MKRGAGFTLIEVMVVLVILMILVRLAYPNYARTINKTRRIEAQVAMIEAIQEQERYYTQHNTYVAFSSAAQNPAALRFKWWSGATAASSAYELEAVACADRTLTECVEVRATPGTANVDPTFTETECATLTLNTAGQQTASGSGERCWP
jgi:type IV pilus assembly protein PilE